MKRLYALRGQSKCGKDTVAQMIIEAGEGVGSTLALAQPLKDLSSRVFGFSQDQLYGPSQSRDRIDGRYVDRNSIAWLAAKTLLDGRVGEDWCNDIVHMSGVPVNVSQAHSLLKRWFEKARTEGQPTPRYILQTLGTEYGRAMDEDIWLKHAWSRIQESTQTRQIVTDVRFFNEAQFFYMKGVDVWHIIRPGADGESAMQAGVANHPSEMQQKSKEMQRFDHIVLVNDGTLDDLRAKVVEELKKHP